MLRQMRSQRTMKTIMWIVAAAFAVGFLFLGQGMNVGSGGGDVQSNLAAVVNGTEIPYETYSGRVSQLAEMERARSSRDDLTSADYERIESQAWDGIITEILVQQEAQRMGLRAEDSEVIAYLEGNPPPFVRQSFLDEQGNFDVQAFRAALADPNTDWRAAEQYVRGLLPSLKMQQMVAARATVSDAEVREEFARRSLRHTVRYVGQRWSDLPVDATPPSEDELRRFHQEQSERWSRGEQVVVEVLRIDKKSSAEDQEELRRDALEMLDELARGVTKDFAALATIYSEDPTASQGGAVGWVRRGFLPETVDDAVWTLAVGTRTDPLMTERGLYVAQVDSQRTTADGQRELYVRQIVLRLQPSATTLDSLRTFAFRVAADARDGFEAAATKHSLVRETLQPISESSFIPGFGFSQRMHDWAFAAKVGDVGGPFGNDDTILVARVAERRPPATEAFETVRERVLAAFQEQRRKDAARTRLDAVVQRMQAGASLDDAARAAGLEVRTPEPFTFYDTVADVGGANEFTAVSSALVPGQTSGVVETSQGAYVVQLLARDTFDAGQYQQARDTHYRSLMDRRVSELLQAWAAELRSAAKIEDRRGPRV